LRTPLHLNNAERAAADSSLTYLFFVRPQQKTDNFTINSLQ